jgi:hypothetical protein
VSTNTRSVPRDNDSPDACSHYPCLQLGHETREEHIGVEMDDEPLDPDTILGVVGVGRVPTREIALEAYPPYLWERLWAAHRFLQRGPCLRTIRFKRHCVTAECLGNE